MLTRDQFAIPNLLVVFIKIIVIKLIRIKHIMNLVTKLKQQHGCDARPCRQKKINKRYDMILLMKFSKLINTTNI